MKLKSKTFLILPMLLGLHLCCYPAQCQSLGELKTTLTSFQSEVVAAKQENNPANPLSTGIIQFIERPQQMVDLTQHQPIVQKAFHWLQIALRQEYQPDLKADATLGDAFFGIDGVGRSDDLIVCQYLKSGVAVQIVDGRSLTIAVLPPAQWNSLTPSYKARDGLFDGFLVGPDWNLKEATDTLFTLPRTKSLQEQAVVENYVNITFGRCLILITSSTPMPC